MMKYLRFPVAAAAFFIIGPSIAQNSGAVPQYAVPIGKGAGTTGFDSAAPGTAGQALVSNGAGAKPSFQSVSSASFGAQTANKVFSGPATGADALPTFRALVGADLPLPGSSSLGGVQSLSASTNNFLTGLGTDGAFTRARPTCSDLSNAAASCATDATNASNISSGTLPAARLPNPSASTLGGVQSAAAVSNQWINSISTSGVPSLSQPAFSNLSGTLGSSQIGTSTITGLTNKATPDSANDYVIIYDNAGTAIKKATVGAVGTAGSVTGGQLPATATNDDASAGNLGEYLSATRASGSATTLTTNVAVNVASVTLTAGDWDVRANLTFQGGGSVSTLKQAVASLSTTSATIDFAEGKSNFMFVGGSLGVDIGSSFQNVVIGPVRFSVSTGTTVYIVGRASFSDNAPKVFGLIEARRVR